MQNYMTNAVKSDEEMMNKLLNDMDAISDDIVYIKEDENGKKIPIPKGYYYVEGTEDDGFVISDSKKDENSPNTYDGNQYVWVPVPNIEEFKLISWNGETIADKETENAYWSSIPNYKNDSTINDTEISSAIKVRPKAMTIKLNRTYNIIPSITKYGGFYIGRFEASYNTEKTIIESKKNKQPFCETKNNILTEISRADQVLIDENKCKMNLLNTHRHLVYGEEWDAMITWINRTNKNYDNKGNYTETIINTGVNENYKVNNIYDISGNVGEYTECENYGLGRSIVEGGNAGEMQSRGIATGGSISANTPQSVYRGLNSEINKANSRNNNDGEKVNNIGGRIALVIEAETEVESTGSEEDIH